MINFPTTRDKRVSVLEPIFKVKQCAKLFSLVYIKGTTLLLFCIDHIVLSLLHLIGQI